MGLLFLLDLTQYYKVGSKCLPIQPQKEHLTMPLVLSNLCTGYVCLEGASQTSAVSNRVKGAKINSPGLSKHCDFDGLSPRL
jgi:hypothetical protein